MLESDRTGPEVLEAHYGFAVPSNALQALQRDGVLLHSRCSMDNVYKAPIAEVSET